MIGGYEEAIPELKEWSESHEGKILITKASTYLSGASYAVYEGIGNEDKVRRELVLPIYLHNYFNIHCFPRPSNICPSSDHSLKSHEN